MKYLDYSVVFKEHPKYVSIAIRITQCPRSCKFCHSPELQQDVGKLLNGYELRKIIDKYYGMFDNMIFMGGDHCETDLIRLLRICKEYFLKTTLWTGSNSVSNEVKRHLDYLKTGHYDHNLGSLTSETTNQKYVEVKTGKEIALCL